MARVDLVRSDAGTRLEPWRASIVSAAESWLLTPWHHLARVKGAGVDCGQHLIMSYIEAGLVPHFETGDYPQDWMMNQDAERFLGWIEQYLDPVARPLPGDIAAWRYGKTFSHGAIVIEWPLIVHAYRREGNVCYGDATKGELARMHLSEGGSAPREVVFYSIAKRL